MKRHIHKLLIDGFLNSVKIFPDRIALDVAGKTYTYRELFSLSQKISKTIVTSTNDSHSLFAVLGHRSSNAYVGVIATLLSGKGYVPLNPKFPVERSYKMLDISGAKTIIVGNECYDYFKELLKRIQTPLLVVFPDRNDTEGISSLFSHHKFIFSEEIQKQEESNTLPQTVPESVAYLLFTSGSTGTPKGVPVSNSNAVSYINYILKKYDVNEHDKCSQSFDLTFDPSVHDMFVCWSSGACLCVVPDTDLIAPTNFIKSKKITIWYSVPSVARFLTQLRMLKPSSFPLLRYSFFSAESLTRKLVEQWQMAAPNAIIVNFYGPTEATIHITHYKWQKESEKRCINGNVPIGWLFESQDCCILNEKNEITDSGTGELCLSGSQVTQGYLNDPEKTACHYVTFLQKGERIWYKTGDIVRKDGDGCIHFLGRVDEQVKIRGFRIELHEIDYTVKNATKKELVITLPLKDAEGSIKKLITFVCTDGDALDSTTILNHCRKKLPDYMIPDEIVFVDKMPVNANGKIDKKKLADSLKKKN